MPLYLDTATIQQMLTMPMALTLVERALRDRAVKSAIDIPRARTQTPAGIQHVLQAAAPELGYIGFKYYYTGKGGSSSYLHLIDMHSGQLAAIIESGWLGMIRTGAATGIASRTLANPGASILGQIGAGYQGMGQLEAVCTALPIREARVYARSRDKLEAWCAQMSAQLGIPVMPAESGPTALAGAHIVNVITRSVTPVIDGDWLEPGQHVNAAGSNALDRREIDSKTIARAALISVDSKATARNECGDLLPAIEQGQLHWDALTEIGDIMVGRAPGRAKSEDITLYQSHGMGIQDLYVGIALLAIAQREGLGSMLAMA